MCSHIDIESTIPIGFLQNVGAVGEDVHAYRFPPEAPISLKAAPKWLASSTHWSHNDELRMAIRQSPMGFSSSNILIILTSGVPLEVAPGDWVVWRMRNEGEDFEAYTNEAFSRRFARKNH